MQKLLRESYDANSYITEAVGDQPKRYFIEGICIQTNIKNGNGRIYPKQVVDREVKRYIKNFLENNRAVGELNHPEEDPRINPRFISHRFIELRESGNDWIGKAQIADKTDMGAIVVGLMECGITMGISSRATGSTKISGGAEVVQDDFWLITPGDIVWEPSAPDAYLTNLMENKEWVYANGKLVHKEYEIKKQVNSLASKKKLNQESMSALFGLIMEHIKGENK